MVTCGAAVAERPQDAAPGAAAGTYAASIEDIQAAATRIAGHAKATPVSDAKACSSLALAAPWLAAADARAAGGGERQRPGGQWHPQGPTRPGRFRRPRPQVMTCSTLDRLAGRSLYFKCEVFQKGGERPQAGARRRACNVVLLSSGLLSRAAASGRTFAVRPKH